MRCDELFGPLFTPAPLREAVSGRAWLQAMLDAERALAAAEAQAGVIPPQAAEAIARACSADAFDPARIGADGADSAAPVVPLVRALRSAVGEEAARYVHWGATTQDIVDTAAMLVARNALGLVGADLDAVAAACAALAERHRSTPIAARTLLQQAVPSTFGLKAAGWLVGILEARRLLATARGGLAAQLGGAAGTLAALGERGPEVLRLYAAELGLVEPVLPWHANRVRMGTLGAALDLTAGAAAKIALDLVLLAQTEVGELAESAEGGRGGSSTMPHKRNPVGAVLALACWRRAHAAAGVLTGALAQELERAAGAWQAEWQSLSDVLASTGGALASVRGSLEGLHVDEERMRANLELTDGAVMAERLSFLLSAELGRPEAQAILEAAARSGRPLREALAADPRVSDRLAPDRLDDAFDPAGYLGSAEAFVDRALALYHSERGGT
ncbi:MAG TPA: 3-carboxy-cis,cis-muconate cycloisomerase [Gaiellaceae bacterium]|nr:3-carboxy-cis,cis-muconate cycloisomerase [Gaiellaceae bacterium]